MSWVDGPLLGVDLETTGKDPETAKIVNAAIVLDAPGQDPIEWEWTAAVEIPEETEKFFAGRYTTEKCLAEGIPERDVVEAMAAVFRDHWTKDCPLVAFNLTYDVTVFDRRNCALGGTWPNGPTDLIGAQAGGPVTGPCLDPYVIDRRLVPKRRGKRQLGMVCKVYGVTLDEASAHTAIADVRATMELMRALGRKHPRMREQSLGRMFMLQKAWHAAWAADFQTWLRAAPRRPEETDAEEEARRKVVITGDWPIVPRGVAEVGLPEPSDEAPTGAYAKINGGGSS